MHAPIFLRYNLFPLIEDVKRKTSEEENFSSRGSRAGRCVSDTSETRRTGLAFAFTLIRQVMYRAFLQTRPLPEYLFSIGESRQIPGFSQTPPGVSTPSAARIITDTYDPAGNRLTKNDNGVITSYTYDDNDRLLTAGNITYSYDNNGNLLSQIEPGLEQRFTYDALNQRIHAEMTSPQGTSTVDYVYDHDGIRVGKTINGTDTVKYLVDANRPYAQVIEEEWTRGGLSATTDYVYGHGLVSQSVDGVHHFYHYDGFHNSRALSDMGGSVTDTYSYDAYGTVLNQTGSTKNPYLYRGEQFDPETDSYYLRARYYQPGTGRLISTDPVEGDTSDPMTLHRYLYGNNDPVNNIDPSGKLTMEDALIAGTIVTGLSTISGFTWLAGDIPGLHDLYYWIAEHLAPDAGIIGISFFGKVRLGEGSPALLDPQTTPGMANINNFIESFPYSSVLTFTGGKASLPNNTFWWSEPVNGGLFFGAEVMASFGSSQLGSFWYIGPQIETGYTRGRNKNRFGLDTNLYTGYVFNLWNCNDYLGAFTTFNFPSGSLFFDPSRIFDNSGPWGLSWTFASHSWRASQESAMTGFNATSFERFELFPAKEVPYAKLAFGWTVSQALITAKLLLSNQNIAAVVTGFGTAATGLIARSKEIYNTKNTYHNDRLNNKPRPWDWKSGPSFMSRLTGLYL